jgi:hypothetical protein
MLVNLTDVFSSEGKVVNKEYLMDAESFTYNSDKFSIISKEPVVITFSNVSNGKALVEGEGKLTIDMQCD